MRTRGLRILLAIAVLGVVIIIGGLTYREVTIGHSVTFQLSGNYGPLTVAGEDAKDFQRALQQSSQERVDSCISAPHRIMIRTPLKTTILQFYNADYIFIPRKQVAIVPSFELRRLLSIYMDHAKDETMFGELIDWEEVNSFFPRYSYGWVRDLDTGLRFQVQRRAGGKHADVQPLTGEDTEIMKMIYGGQWSWHRRAVVLEVGTRKIAGSMNGMPHGAGKIKDNNFKGHFCIHFMGSKTHIHSHENLAHQMMVWKAAGEIDRFVRMAKPDEIVHIFITALDQRSLDIGKQAIGEGVDWTALEGWLDQVSFIGIDKLVALEEEKDGVHEYKLYLTYGIIGEKKNRREQFTLVVYQRNDGGWRLDSLSIQPLWLRE